MGYVLMLAAGFFVLRQPWVTVKGNSLSPDRAVFATINAATLTGFTERLAINDYTVGGQIVIFVLTLAGTFFALLLGAWAVARITRLEYSDARIAGATGIVIALAALLGVAGLWGPTVTPFAAAFNGISALGNSGLYSGKLPAAHFWSVHVILLPLALLGGWGIAVLLEIFNGIFHLRPLSTHARVTLLMSGVVYLAGTLALFAAFAPWQSNTQYFYANASAAAINARTAGFAFTNVGAMPRVGQWIVLGLMLIGAGSGSAAGGIKLTTIYVICGGVRRALRGATVGRLFGVAMVWITIYFALVIATLLALLATQPEMPADRLLMLAVSAASNVGLAHDPITLVGPSLFVLSLAMLLGRTLPLIVLWWLVYTTRDVDVAVG